MSYLLDTLTKQPESNTVYFFCDDKDERQRTATTILKSLVFQLLRQNVSFYKHAMDTFELFRHKEQAVWSPDTLWKVFSNIACDTEAASAPIYCLLDALDECQQMGDEEFSRNHLLSRIAELYSPNASARCQIRFIITCRPYVDLQALLKDFDTIPLGLGQGATENDISLFITERLQEMAFEKRFSRELAETVAEHLRREARGMFLWVSLVIKDLSTQCFSDAEVYERLNTLPADLYAFYDNILGRIHTEHRKRAKQMFMWIVYAARPLALKELNIALAISAAPKPPTSLDDIKRYLSNNLQRELETRCGLLVEFQRGLLDQEWLDLEAYTVHLSHQSVKDFFTTKTEKAEESHFTAAHHSQFYIPSEIANSSLGETCVTYILSKDFRDSFQWALTHEASPSPSIVQPVTKHYSYDFPLSTYCVENWVYHLQNCQSINDVIKGAFLKFQSSHAENFGIWVALYFPMLNRYRAKAGGFFPIHAASLLGIKPVLSLLLEGEVDGNVADLFGRTPLMLAVRGGHKGAIELLVKHGVDVNTKDNRGSSPLFIAAEGMPLETLKLLVEGRADVDCISAFGENPPSEEIGPGSVETIKFLVENGAHLGMYDADSIKKAFEEEMEAREYSSKY